MTHIEVMKQALEALEMADSRFGNETFRHEIQPSTYGCNHNAESCPLCAGLVSGWKAIKAANAAITSLRQAIAEAEKQEPVAKDQWWVKELEGFWGSADYVATLDTRRAAKTAIDVVFGNAPPPRQPLTDEQRIKILKDNTVQSFHGDSFDVWGIIDDIEAAHNIKENT